MPPKPLRQPTRKEAVALPQNARFTYLSQVSQLLASEGYLKDAAYFGSRALKTADTPGAAVPRRIALQHCEVCGVFLSPSSCARIECIGLSSRNQRRSVAANAAPAVATSNRESASGKAVKNTVAVVRTCQVCGHRNSQPFAVEHAARQLAASEAQALERFKLEKQQLHAPQVMKEVAGNPQQPQLPDSGAGTMQVLTSLDTATRDTAAPLPGVEPPAVTSANSADNALPTSTGGQDAASGTRLIAAATEGAAAAAAGHVGGSIDAPVISVAVRDGMEAGASTAEAETQMLDFGGLSQQAPRGEAAGGDQTTEELVFSRRVPATEGGQPAGVVVANIDHNTPRDEAFAAGGAPEAGSKSHAARPPDTVVQALVPGLEATDEAPEEEEVQQAVEPHDAAKPATEQVAAAEEGLSGSDGAKCGAGAGAEPIGAGPTEVHPVIKIPIVEDIAEQRQQQQVQQVDDLTVGAMQAGQGMDADPDVMVAEPQDDEAMPEDKQVGAFAPPPTGKACDVGSPTTTAKSHDEDISIGPAVVSKASVVPVSEPIETTGNPVLASGVSVGDKRDKGPLAGDAIEEVGSQGALSATLPGNVDATAKEPVPCETSGKVAALDAQENRAIKEVQMAPPTKTEQGVDDPDVNDAAEAGMAANGEVIGKVDERDEAVGVASEEQPATAGGKEGPGEGDQQSEAHGHTVIQLCTLLQNAPEAEEDENVEHQDRSRVSKSSLDFDPSDGRKSGSPNVIVKGISKEGAKVEKRVVAAAGAVESVSLRGAGGPIAEATVSENDQLKADEAEAPKALAGDAFVTAATVRADPVSKLQLSQTPQIRMERQREPDTVNSGAEAIGPPQVTVEGADARRMTNDGEDADATLVMAGASGGRGTSSGKICRNEDVEGEEEVKDDRYVTPWMSSDEEESEEESNADSEEEEAAAVAALPKAVDAMPRPELVAVLQPAALHQPTATAEAAAATAATKAPVADAVPACEIATAPSSVKRRRVQPYGPESHPAPQPPAHPVQQVLPEPHMQERPVRTEGKKACFQASRRLLPSQHQHERLVAGVLAATHEATGAVASVGRAVAGRAGREARVLIEGGLAGRFAAEAPVEAMRMRRQQQQQQPEAEQSGEHPNCKRPRARPDWLPEGYVSETSIHPLLPQEREDGVLVYEAPYAPGLFDLRPVVELEWPHALHHPRHRRRFLRECALYSAHHARFATRHPQPQAQKQSDRAAAVTALPRQHSDAAAAAAPPGDLSRQPVGGFVAGTSNMVTGRDDGKTTAKWSGWRLVREDDNGGKRDIKARTKAIEGWDTRFELRTGAATAASSVTKLARKDKLQRRLEKRVEFRQQQKRKSDVDIKEVDEEDETGSDDEQGSDSESEGLHGAPPLGPWARLPPWEGPIGGEISEELEEEQDDEEEEDDKQQAQIAPWDRGECRVRNKVKCQSPGELRRGATKPSAAALNKPLQREERACGQPQHSQQQRKAQHVQTPPSQNKKRVHWEVADGGKQQQEQPHMHPRIKR